MLIKLLYMTFISLGMIDKSYSNCYGNLNLIDPEVNTFIHNVSLTTGSLNCADNLHRLDNICSVFAGVNYNNHQIDAVVNLLTGQDISKIESGSAVDSDKLIQARKCYYLAKCNEDHHFFDFLAFSGAGTAIETFFRKFELIEENANVNLIEFFLNFQLFENDSDDARVLDLAFDNFLRLNEGSEMQRSAQYLYKRLISHKAKHSKRYCQKYANHKILDKSTCPKENIVQTEI